MFRLGVISDSHDREIWLERYLALCKKERYDAVCHLGDYQSDARWLERRIASPLISVAGNCDMFSKVPRIARANYGAWHILAVHGHAQDVKYGYDRLSYAAEDCGANIALFGHTHIPYTGYVGSVLLMNPGALMDGCYGELFLDGERAIPRLKSFLED